MVALAALVPLLLVAAPATAERSKQPTKLWSEYPLVPKESTARTTGSGSIGTFTPPVAAVDADTVPGADAKTPWSLLALLSAVAAIAVVAVARASRPLASALRARPRADDRGVPEPMQLRETPEDVAQPPAGAPLGQYAPVTAVGEEPAAAAARSVVRRTGLLRSRYVVVVDDAGGSTEQVGGARSFWRVGGERFRERAAERAWDDLVDDLRRSGWEPDSGRRSGFYVLLRRIEPDPPSLLPTIEAYTRREDAGEG